MKKKLLSVISIVMVLLIAMSSFAIMSSALTVKIDAPVFKKISATCTSVTIEWEEYEDSDIYFLVYRSATGKAGTWTKIATTKAGAVSYTDKTVAPAKTYVYTVKAYFVGKDGTKYLSDMSGKHSIKTGLEKPSFSLAGNSGLGVLLKWDKRNDVTGFILYKSTTGKAGSWTRLGSTVKSNKAGSYTDSDVKIGSTYYYCIKAYKVINGKEYYSKSSKAYKITIKDVAVPQNLNAIAKDDGVYFTFDKVPATKGYIIYRSETGKKGSWTKLHITTSNNTTGYVDTAAEQGKIYYYTVKSYKSVGGKNYYSDSAKAVRVANLSVVPEIKFTPAEITFNDYYEEIKVTLEFKNFESKDDIRIFIDSTEITNEFLADKAKVEEFLKTAKFNYSVDEEKSTDEKIVLIIKRLAPGTGTLKVAHAKYGDIYAELKVNCPELPYDKDFEKALLNVEAAGKATLNAYEILLQAKDATENRDAYVKNAIVQLTGAKSSIENAKLLLIKYEATYNKYPAFKEELAVINDCLDSINDALNDISGENVDVKNIENAIREIEGLAEDLLDD